MLKKMQILRVNFDFHNELEQFYEMRGYVFSLIEDSYGGRRFGNRMPIEIVNVGVFNSIDEFLQWLYGNYPKYLKWLDENI